MTKCQPEHRVYMILYNHYCQTRPEQHNLNIGLKLYYIITAVPFKVMTVIHYNSNGNFLLLITIMFDDDFLCEYY
jgi:hypothetical protein